MSISIDRLIESIRFDVDYNCTEQRDTAPLQGSINKELYTRLTKMERKGNPMFTPGMRIRVLNSLNLKATPENHDLFNEAVTIFKERLYAHTEEANMDYSGTETVISG